MSLNIMTVVTPSYEKVLEDYFLTTLPEEFDKDEIYVVKADPKYDNCHSNLPLLKEFEQYRLGKILEYAEEKEGEKVFFIDSDVVFAKGAQFKEELCDLLDEYDFAFQFNDSWYNFGVFSFSCNERVLSFLDDFLNNRFDKILKNNKFHDQHVVNEMLKEETYKNIKHTHLPFKFFANHFARIKYPKGTPGDVVLFHATSCGGLGKKIQLLKDFKSRYYDNK